MQLLITCDYLVSPSICSDVEFIDRVESLVFAQTELRRETGRVLVERNALNKLVELESFPCASLFDKNIGLLGVGDEYSGRDLARVVNNVIALSENLPGHPSCAAEWSRKTIAPQLNGFVWQRNFAVSALVEEMGVASGMFGASCSLLHHPLERRVEKISISGEITSLVPEIDRDYPISLDNNFFAYCACSDFLADLDGFDIYTKSECNCEEVELSFRTGAISLSNRLGVGLVKKFSLGSDFLETVVKNQCGPGGRYSGAAFEAICYVLIGADKYETNPFYTNLKTKSQLVKDGKYAWRTHITKHGPALRLMHWTDGEVVELANIGCKNELVIF